MISDSDSWVAGVDGDDAKYFNYLAVFEPDDAVVSTWVCQIKIADDFRGSAAEEEEEYVESKWN